MDVPIIQHRTAEGQQIRSVLQLSADSGTDVVLDSIQNLLRHHDHLTEMWHALTELLLLSPDTGLQDVLGNVNAYIRECDYMQVQEKRHLGIIHKLQRDRVEILKRFHINQKIESIAKIRGKARFRGSMNERNEAFDRDEDLGIFEDATGCESLEDTNDSPRTSRQRGLARNKTMPDKEIWHTIDDQNTDKYLINAGIKQNPETNMTSKNITITESRYKALNELVTREVTKSFILPSVNKAPSRDNARHNVTPGTRESQPQTKQAKDKVMSAPQASTGSGNKATAAKPRLTISSKTVTPKTTSVPSSPVGSKMDVTMWTSLKVTPKGGCFDLPQIGIRISVPGGCLARDCESVVLTLTLHWPGTIQCPTGERRPVGPTIDIKPNGIPFSKPIVVSIPHKMSLEADKKDNSNLILMKLDAGRQVWGPIENDSESQAWSPLGLVTSASLIIHVPLTATYALVPAGRAKVVPRSLRMLGFIQYSQQEKTQNKLKLEICSLEENILTSLICDEISESMKRGPTPKYRVFDRCLSLSGKCPIEVTLREVLDGWAITCDHTQIYDPRLAGLDPVVTFTLDHSFPQLRCLLAKVNFQLQPSTGGSKDNGQSETVTLCLDLDQIDEQELGDTRTTSGTTPAHSHKDPQLASARSPRKSGTFTAEYFEDSEGRAFNKDQLRNDDPDQTTSIRLEVMAQPCLNCWIPEDVKTELVDEIKGEMPGVDKWYALVNELEMSVFREVLQQSTEPVYNLLSYCEVMGVGVLKVKDVLDAMRFSEGAKVLAGYISNNPDVVS